MKKCSKCGIEKALGDFYPASQCIGGVRPDCKACMNKQRHQRQLNGKQKDPNVRRGVVLKNKYGITFDQFEDMKKSQDSKCKICGSTDPGPKNIFAVDHCHKTGKVRGLLCYLCNIGLGSFRDSPEFLNNAISYLKENDN